MRQTRRTSSELRRLVGPLARLLDAGWRRMHWWVAAMALLYAVSGITRDPARRSSGRPALGAPRRRDTGHARAWSRPALRVPSTDRPRGAGEDPARLAAADPEPRRVDASATAATRSETPSIRSQSAMRSAETRTSSTSRWSVAIASATPPTGRSTDPPRRTSCGSRSPRRWSARSARWASTTCSRTGARI